MLKYSNSPSGSPQLSRRKLLNAGALAGISLFLPSVSVSQDRERVRERIKKTVPTIVWISFDGGKSSLESYDPKPDAEDVVRGPFGTVATSVRGVRFSEHCANMATTGFAHGSLIRSVVTDGSLDHVAAMRQRLRRVGEAGPHMLSQHAARNGGIQPFFAKSPDVIHGFDYDPLAWGVPRLMLNMPYDPAERRLQAPRIAPMDERLERDRLPLLAALERDAPVIHSPAAEHVDRIRAQAVAAMRRAGRAMEITDRELEAYGDLPRETAQGNWVTTKSVRSIAPMLLTVRKLVEQDICGAIGVRLGYHDLHEYLVEGTRAQEPVMDRALSTFLTELEERGLLEKTVVVLSSEFGRGNRMNGSSEGKETNGDDGFGFEFRVPVPGRDHGDVSCAWMFGGGRTGIKKGVVHGATDPQGRKLERSTDNVTAEQLADIAIEALNPTPDRAKRSRLPPLFA